MKPALAFVVAVFFALLGASASAQPAPVVKTNPMKVYMHYMPWFETPQSLGGTLGGTNWGYHWKFNNRNPNVVDASGRRQIASHFYPKIGPYSSSDPAVIEYHSLLMKYAGIDGVLIDWYGQQGSNGDVGSLLASSNAIVDRVDDAGLTFGVVLEDRFSTVSSSNQTADINKAKANVAYLRDNYFNKPNYIRINAGNDPLLSVFGPIKFQSPSQWTDILGQAGEPVDFTTLWYESADAGANADGEYAWIYEDGAQNNHLNHQRNFWQVRAPTLGTAGGVAYPGFDDYYQEGGTGTVIGFDIPHANGQTLASTLTLASTYAANVDYLQLATFNDFGEGTMFEPTVETGFAYLRQVQQFTGVSYDEDELKLVFRLYRARKEFAGQAAIQMQLDSAAANLAALQVSAAEAILNTLSLEGDFNDDGRVDGSDFAVWQRQLGQTGLYPLATKGADGNADGVVDGADLALWRRDLGLQVAALTAVASVPEPSSAGLLLVGLALAEISRRTR